MEKDTPSPERLRRALRAGDSPLSRAALRVATLATVVGLAPAVARAVRSRFTARLEEALATPAHMTPRVLVEDVSTLAGPLLLAAFVVAAVLGVAQTGGAVAWKKTGVDRGAPRTGVGQLFSVERVVDAARGVLVVVTLSAAALGSLSRSAPEFARAVEQRGALATRAGGAVERGAWTVVFGALVFAIVDVVLKRVRFARRWSLSPSEAKRERRDDEGDPDVKRARRRVYESP